MKKSNRKRLDVVLFERGLTPSREHARSLILAGKVLVAGVVADKPGRETAVDADILVREDLPFVSRGGVKLKGALEGLGIDPSGLTILDAGASTGGFTDCLLKSGAERIIAVDVGYGQFDWKLRTDARVRLLERTNIRSLDTAVVGSDIDAAVADLSFISLRLVLGTLKGLVKPGGWLLVLVKPQFEVGRADVGKGGVVRDQKKMVEAVDGIKSFAQTIGLSVIGEIESPIKGPKGNREFFLYLLKQITE